MGKAGKIRRMKASALGQNKFVVHIWKLKCGMSLASGLHGVVPAAHAAGGVSPPQHPHLQNIQILVSGVS